MGSKGKGAEKGHKKLLGKGGREENPILLAKPRSRRKKPFYRNGTFQFFFSIAFALVLAVAVLIYQESTKLTADDVVKRLEQAKTADSEHLLNKYPGGYVLFGTLRNEIVTPGSSSAIGEYSIDWSSAKIVSVDEDYLRIRLPDVKVSGARKMLIAGNTVGIPRKFRSDVTRVPILATPEQWWAEIIEEYEHEMLVVIGIDNRH